MVANNEFSSNLQQRIEAAYKESGNSHGWRLLASPACVLEGAEVAFIGLTPAVMISQLIMDNSQCHTVVLTS